MCPERGFGPLVWFLYDARRGASVVYVLSLSFFLSHIYYPLSLATLLQFSSLTLFSISLRPLH